MRLLILIAFLFTITASSAQNVFPHTYLDYYNMGSLLNNKNVKDTVGKKWFLSKYSSISTSFSFFKGGNATVVSAPMGIQLNHRLNNNLFAFAGVAIAPAYVSLNSSFLNADFSKVNAGSSFNSKTLGVYSRAQLGLQYVNDERTFSISGSVGIERSTFPQNGYGRFISQNRPVQQ